LLAGRYPHTRLHVLLRKPDPHLFAEHANVGQQRADLKDIGRFIEAAMDFQPDAIIHCAASGVRPSEMSWLDVVDRNVSASVQLFMAASELTDCHFVHVSTGLVYDARGRACHEGDPVDTLHPYGASKAAADCLLRAGADRLHRHLSVVRPFSFTGIHDGGARLFPSLLRKALAGEAFAMSAGTQMRDFCAVQDVAEAIRVILEQGTEPQRNIFNVGSGRPIMLKEIVLDVVEQLGLEVDVRFGEKAFHPHEPMHLVADIGRMQGMGWEPRTNLAYAVWQMAKIEFPDLQVREPVQFL
jgi:nucleoside-diphosphate-sugar epimerase